MCYLETVLAVFFSSLSAQERSDWQRVTIDLKDAEGDKKKGN